MKKLMFSLIMLALVLAFGFVLVSCDDGMGQTWSITVQNNFSDSTITRIRVDGSSVNSSTWADVKTLYDENISIPPQSSKVISFRTGSANATSMDGRIYYYYNNSSSSIAVMLRDGRTYTVGR